MNRRATALVLALPLLFACDPAVVTGEAMPVDFYDNLYEQGLINCTESQDTGYSSGNSFAIDVVTVDGKPAEVETANAYWVMQQAAAGDGVAIRIVSGFRTMGQQQYLYGCYVNCNCNSCNLAATPGYSNHQSGHALDLNTSEAGVLHWLNHNGAAYGFSRTVPSEAWHWEWWGGGPGGGPCGGSPECLADPNYGGCSETTVTLCNDSNQVSTGDCAAFGGTCSTAGGAPHCVHFMCWSNLSGAEDGTFCADDTKVGTCDLGVYSEGDCAAFGGTCSDAGGETHCVHFLCWSHLDGGEDGTFCLDDGTMGRCQLGAFEEISCGGSESCSEDGTSAQCSSDVPPVDDPPVDDPPVDDPPIDDTPPDDTPPDDTPPDDTPPDDIDPTPGRLVPAGDVTRIAPPSRARPRAYAEGIDTPAPGCSSTGDTPASLFGLLALFYFAARRTTRSGDPR